MSLNIQLTPEVEAKLRARAEAEGKDPAAFALEAVTEKLAGPNGSGSHAAAHDRLDAWERFVTEMRQHAKNLPPHHFVDDSRESIYEGRGE